jgi:phage-related protein
MIALGTAFLPVLGQLLTAVTPAISGFADWITQSGALQGALQLVSSAIQGVVTVLGWLGSGLSQIGSIIAPIFDGLASNAGVWGQNLMVGFINGVESMIGALVGVLNQIMAEVAGFMGFASPAKKGPGSQLNSSHGMRNEMEANRQ